MAYDNQNAFAKILSGEWPSIKLYEDEHTIAIMDIMPQSDGHALVIPKEAAETLVELSEAAAVACIRVVRRLTIAVKQAMASEGVMVMQLNGSGAGQTVPHVHFHVIPRSQGLMLVAHGAKRADNDHLLALAARIRSALAGVS